MLLENENFNSINTHFQQSHPFSISIPNPSNNIIELDLILYFDTHEDNNYITIENYDWEFNDTNDVSMTDSYIGSNDPNDIYQFLVANNEWRPNDFNNFMKAIDDYIVNNIKDIFDNFNL